MLNAAYPVVFPTIGVYSSSVVLASCILVIFRSQLEVCTRVIRMSTYSALFYSNFRMRDVLKRMKQQQMMQLLL